MAELFREITLKKMVIKNRIVMAPMCMFCAKDGLVNDWHFIHYASRAVGGVGLILVEATGVESRGRITDADLGLWSDDGIEGMKRLVDACHEQGAKIGIQLGHAGRKSEVSQEEPIAPSPLPFSERYRVPKEMSIKDIKDVIAAFVAAAIRADKAGFDTIEIHGAHGYLISEFLSPLTNQRTDAYGGSWENRSRFLKEILRGVGGVWPQDKPIILRVSAEDYMEGGNHVEDITRIINELKTEGIDLVNVSSGGVVDVRPTDYPGYQVGFAELIRKETGLPVIAGGLLSAPELAEEILRNERADMIYLGRELLRNPYWPLQAAKELGVDIQWPMPYSRGKK